jgi:hypothetical protein
MILMERQGDKIIEVRACATRGGGVMNAYKILDDNTKEEGMD